MNVIPTLLKSCSRLLPAAVAAGCMLVSCDSVIYDDEGDCSVDYRLEFRYDRNMKWADAFAQEVESVNLYAFDKDGLLVWEQSESGDALAGDDYSMKLDLPAGDYTLVAWCGLDGGDGDRSFSVPQVKVGETRIGELQCSLNRLRDASGAYSVGPLRPLFHGLLEVSLPDDNDGGSYTYTMDLTKDTNHVRVILQQLSGKAVDVDDFTFRIEEENGLMDYDNSLLPDELITYRAYHTGSGTAGLGIDDYPEVDGRRSAARPSSREITSVSVAIADLSIARLVEGRKTYLIIDSADGRRVARVPLTDYALLLKDGYGREMTDQDYLDRQDEYSLTFFLDDSEEWIGTSIIINSWKVVFNDVDF